MTVSGSDSVLKNAHFKPCFRKPSSKLCLNWLPKLKGTPYLRAAVHRRCQRSPKGLGTVNMVLNVHRNHMIRLIRDEEKGSGGGGGGEVKGVWRWEKREIIIIPVATLSPPE